MSYKTNLKNPKRLTELSQRRKNHHLSRATTFRRDIFRVRLLMNGQYMLVARNKYILSGPDSNVAQSKGENQ